LPSVRDDIDLEAGLLEVAAQHLADRRVVVDDQDSWGDGTLLGTVVGQP
jgi:hypothetical protein